MRCMRAKTPGYIYGRYGVPNHVALEEALCDLEGAEAALATTSGTSAISSTLFALLEGGDRSWPPAISTAVRAAC